MSEESIKVQMKQIINNEMVNVSPIVDASCVNGLSDNLDTLTSKIKGNTTEITKLDIKIDKIYKEITQEIEKDKRIQKKKNWIARSRKRGK